MNQNEHPRETFWKTMMMGNAPHHYVEIGTCFGAFSEFLLRSNIQCRLTTIDPYRKFPAEEYRDALNDYSQEQCDQKYLHVYGKLNQKYGDRVRMLRSMSVDASKIFNDNSLDFVYIDGNHEYRAVVKDITAWLPKVKKGGILGGDDVEDIHLHHDGGSVIIQHSPGSWGQYGVHQALIDIKKQNPWFDYKIVGNQWYWVKK